MHPPHPLVIAVVAVVSRLIYTVKVVGVITLHQSVTRIFSVPRNFFIFTLLTFATVVYLCKNNFTKKHIDMKNYTRQYRQLSDETKNKISTSAKNKPKSEEHKRRIQQSMLRYWQTVPNKPDSLSMDDYLNPNNNDDNR